MLNTKNRELIATTYFNIRKIENGRLQFINKTKRTYHFKLGDVKVSIPIKALKNFEEEYR